MRIYQVDAFAQKIFSGNPAGVCLLPSARDELWMQRVAAEMNLSETAFLVRQGNGFTLRWFTPLKEVDLCGHATLASAHILYETNVLQQDQTARFSTMKSGLLTATKRSDSIQLNFPAEEPENAVPPKELLNGLNVKPTYVGINRFDYLVEVESEDIVRSLDPDFALLKHLGVRGVMVTSISSSPGFDFVSRYFAPSFGIDEDPVTGSAHCCLGPYWKRRLNKDSFRAYQASRRGGVVDVHVDGERVILGGHAVTVFSAEMSEG